MTAPLDEETKKLRNMTPAQLADEVGTRKAAIADVEERLEVLKAEFIRRKIPKASGELFDVTITPPDERRMIDRLKLEAMLRPEFIDEHLMKSVPTGPVLRCTARKNAAAKRQAA